MVEERKKNSLESTNVPLDMSKLLIDNDIGSAYQTMKRGVTQAESIWSHGEGPLKSFLGAENAIEVGLDDFSDDDGSAEEKEFERDE